MDPKAEGLQIAEIDLAAIAVAKSAADPAGHYSRPDVFRLMFNKKPAPAVVNFDDGGSMISDEVSDAAEDQIAAANSQ